MGLGRVVAGVGLVLAGVAVFLSTVDQLTPTMHWLGRWWPTLLIAVGFLLLVRAAKPTAVAAAALLLVATGFAALATMRDAIGQRGWTVVAAAALVVGGMVVLLSRPRGRGTFETNDTPSILVVLSSRTVQLQSNALAHTRVIVLGGSLALDLRCAEFATKGVPQVDLTVCFGRVDIVPPRDINTWFHHAFGIGRYQPAGKPWRERSKADREWTELLVSAISVFGSVTFSSETVPTGKLALSDTSPEPEHSRSSAKK